MWKKAFKAVLLKFYLVHSWMYCLILTSVKFRILVGFQVPTLPQIFWGTLIIHLCSQICHLCCRLSHHLYHQQLCVWFAHQSSERCSIEDHLGQCWWKVSLTKANEKSLLSNSSSRFLRSVVGITSGFILTCSNSLRAEKLYIEKYIS